MKRYLVFSGDNYYPLGGGQDYQNAFDTLEEASRYADGCVERGDDWANVLDADSGVVEYSINWRAQRAKQ